MDFSSSICLISLNLAYFNLSFENCGEKITKTTLEIPLILITELYRKLG